MIKIDRLRGLSILVLVLTVVLVIAEFVAGPRFDASFAILILVLLVVALEKVRLELRDLREDIQKERK